MSAVVVAGIASVPATAHAAGTADPASDVSPSSGFVNACSGMGTTKAANDSCDAAATHDFTAVWASEGISSTFALPADFDTLSVPAQLLAISDVERVGRGLPPVVGMSSALNSLAQAGADADDDPSFPHPFTGSSGGSNWAGAGNSALLDDFYWMYDDGIGSGNLDCTASDLSGCWGHRHNIISSYSAPILMGAGVAYGTTYGTSMATEYIGGDHADTADVAPTWATINGSTTPPPAVHVSISASKTAVRAHHAVTLVAPVATTAAPVVGTRVELQQRTKTSPWTDLAAQTTSTGGVASFVRHPYATAKYRMQVRNASNSNEATSVPVRVAVS